jgi:hypothetical protein
VKKLKFNSLKNLIKSLAPFEKAIKWGLPFICVYILIEKLSNESLIKVQEELLNFDLWLLVYSSLVLIFLSIVNWILDTATWHLFLPRGAITFLRLIRLNVISLSFSFFTPFQLGEYYGKQIVSQELQLRKSYFRTLAYRTAKSLAKLILGFGVAALLLFPSQQLLAYLSGGIAVLLFLGYVFQDSFWSLPKVQSFLSEVSLSNIEKPAPKTFRLLALGSSAIKLFVYCFQFFICVWVISPELASQQLFGTIVLFYTISAWVPSIGFLDPFVKASLGLLIFPENLLAPWLVISSASIVWLVNVGIPAVMGSLLYWQTAKELN